MSADCCAPARGATIPSCPENGEPGHPVQWRTVAALTTGPVPPRRDFWLCGDAGCEVVYFAEDGACWRVADLRIVPGIKSASPDALLCFCFVHRRHDFLAELRQTGESRLFSQIASEVKAGNCACEVRNPTGRCCLGEIKKEIAAAVSL